MKYKIDVIRIWEGSTTLNEWVIGKSPDSRTTFRVGDEKHKPVKFEHVNIRKDDVSQMYFKKVLGREFGFGIQFPYGRGKDYYLLIRYEGHQAKIKYNEELITKRASVAHKRMEEFKDLTNMETVHMAIEFWKEHGLKALVVKSKHKLQGIDDNYDYSEWYELTKPTDEGLAERRKHISDFEPMLSVVIPAYRTPERYLKEILGSIIKQTYASWGVCAADGSPRREGPGYVLKGYADRDRRVRCEVLGSNRGVSGNTNTTLDMAKGDFITLADHDDTFPPNAFYEVVKVTDENPDCQAIYSDGDRLDMDGKTLFDSHFKPDFNPDLLASVGYICHLFVIRQDLLKQVGGFRQEFSSAQDYDFIFRCAEAAKRMYHIPKILYHQHCRQNSTASDPESKMCAFEVGSRTIMAHYERMGIPVVMVEEGVGYDVYHTTFEIQGEPLVPVIIPNKDHSQDLDVCVWSLMEGSSYRNLESIIVENNSPQKEAFAYCDKMQAEHSNFRVVTQREGFNYSAINNYGVSFAKGEYLLLLNNDTELIGGGSIKGMLGSCQREDVGIVGARLLCGDDTMQHAGVVIGFGGIVGHTFIDLHKAENSYFRRIMCAQDCGAVTAACLMAKGSVFDQMDGLNPELAMTFNDINYCMKVHALGKLVVYAPYSCFYHYEPESRGLEDTPGKTARFNREAAIFIRKWLDIAQNGDPCYSPNLTLRKPNFVFKDLLREKIGEPYGLKIYQQSASEDNTRVHE